MNDAIILQQIYPKGGYENLISYSFSTTMSYCNKHHIDYQFTNSKVNDNWELGQGGWAKLLLVKNALKKYKYVVWMDADTIIIDESKDMREAVSNGIGVTWHANPEPHYNVGMLYFVKDLSVTRFLDEWISRFPGYDNWFEQRVFNDMSQLYPDVVSRISCMWNSWFGHEEFINPVVASFHDCGPWQKRIKLMSLIKEKYVYLEANKNVGVEPFTS
jgi:hypothetical protein